MLRFLGKTIDFLLFGNLYVSLGAFFLTTSTFVQLQINCNHYYSTLVFFSTLFIYNFQRIFYTKQTDSSLLSIRRNWVAKHQRELILLSAIGFIGTSILFFFNDYKIIFYLSPMLLLSLFYFLPFIKLRKNAWFKLIILTSVWTISTCIVPLLLNGNNIFERNSLMHITTRFCFMIAICIPFDIRDLHIDKSENISTLPILYGENTTRRLATFFMLMYFLLLFLDYYEGVFGRAIFATQLLSGSISLVLIILTNFKRSEYYYTAALDGTMILQGGLMLFVNLFS